MYAQSMSCNGSSRSCLDHEDTRKLFISLYPNRLSSIVKHFDAKNWITVSKFHELDHEELLESISGNTNYFRGLRWGEYTKFAVLDIDTNSQYHQVHELQKLKSNLRDIGLHEVRLYRSSISDGWHVYIPLSEWVLSSEIESLLKQFMKFRNYKIISGQLEIFPSNNGLRLPLQKDFAWLNNDASIAVTREELTTEQALSQFVIDITDNTNDWEVTKLRIKEKLEEHRLKKLKEAEIERQLRLSTDGMDELFQGRIIQKNYDRGKTFFREGLKSNGERHDAVICVEHYLWHGDSSLGLRPLPGRFNDHERYEAILSWLKQKHNDCCNHINRGDWKTVEAQIQRAVNWRSDEVPERTPYVITSDRALDRIIALTKSTGRTWSPEDWRKANERRLKRARRKIEDAVAEIIASGRKLTMREVARVSGCSRQTVSKHRDLLSSGLGDLEPGGVGEFGSVSSSRSDTLVDLPLSSSEKNLELPAKVLVLDLDHFFLDPVSSDSNNSFSTVLDLDSRKYVPDIASPEPLEPVVSYTPVLSIASAQKRSLEGRRIVISENGQLAIDFGFQLTRQRKRRRGRSPPA